jgi:plasmid stability protein
MAQLLVRNLDENLVRALQVRAAQHGRSAEAEHREILKQALDENERRPDFKAFWASMPEVDESFDECFEFTRGPAREVDF